MMHSHNEKRAGRHGRSSFALEGDFGGGDGPRNHGRGPRGRRGLELKVAGEAAGRCPICGDERGPGAGRGRGRGRGLGRGRMDQACGCGQAGGACGCGQSGCGCGSEAGQGGACGCGPAGNPGAVPSCGCGGGGRGHGRGGRGGPRGGRGHGFGGGRGGRGRGRRPRGLIRAAILVLLQERPMHGYEIIQTIAERTDGQWTPSPGSVYPALQMLTEEGLITSEEQDDRAVATLTEAGTAWLEDNKEAIGDPFAADKLAGRGGGVLRGALDDLSGVVAHGAAAASEEQREQIAAVLAEAKREVYLILAEEHDDDDDDEDGDED